MGVEAEPDPVSGARRRHTKVVRGSRDEAEVALARLKVSVDGGEAPTATRARTVRAACELYLSEARTELQTQRTDRSACRRICATVLPGGQLLGDQALAKVDWRMVEEVFAKWGDQLQPPTQARYALGRFAPVTGLARHHPERFACSNTLASVEVEVALFCDAQRLPHLDRGSTPT